MRIRTLLTLGIGAAIGASAAYLGDPDHGPQRRHEARQWAWREGRQWAWAGCRQLATTAQALVVAAIDGYRESRQDA